MPGQRNVLRKSICETDREGTYFTWPSPETNHERDYGLHPALEIMGSPVVELFGDMMDRITKDEPLYCHCIASDEDLVNRRDK